MNLLTNIISTVAHRSTSTITESYASEIALLISSVTADYLNFNAKQVEQIVDAERLSYRRHSPPAPVIYIPIFEDHVVSLGIFHLRFPYSIIPLHDHPGIHGFIKVIHGGASVTQISAIRDQPETPKLLRITDLKTVSAEEHNNTVLKLTPDKFNFHEIVPLPGHDSLSFFDVLTPPYDPNGGRDCSYYNFIPKAFASETESFIFQQDQPPPLEIFETDLGPYFGPSCNE